MDEAQIEQLLNDFEQEANFVGSFNALDGLKSKYLGSKSLLKSALKSLSGMSGAEKSLKGKLYNQARGNISAKIAQIKQNLANKAVQEALRRDKKDTTRPTDFLPTGSLHPLQHIENKLHAILKHMGFHFAEGPEVETAYYNFTALNTPENHPATTLQDTFYLQGGKLLRSHTSTVQVHMMEMHTPPLNIYTVGRVFRADTPDATHSPCFHQCEGLIVDTHTSLQDLVQTLSHIIDSLFDEKLKMRFRPSYFPFTEPSLECDIFFKGKWMEVLGCGLVHPNVLSMSSIDPEVYRGFAFGIGLERLAMLYYGIDDLRLFYEGDVRFLEQFKQAEEL